MLIFLAPWATEPATKDVAIQNGISTGFWRTLKRWNHLGELVIETRWVDENEAEAIGISSKRPIFVPIKKLKRRGPYEPGCSNCYEGDHVYRDCKAPKRVFCHKCGITGVIYLHCRHETEEN